MTGPVVYLTILCQQDRIYIIDDMCYVFLGIDMPDIHDNSNDI